MKAPLVLLLCSLAGVALAQDAAESPAPTPAPSHRHHPHAAPSPSPKPARTLERNEHLTVSDLFPFLTKKPGAETPPATPKPAPAAPTPPATPRKSWWSILFWRHAEKPAPPPAPSPSPAPHRKHRAKPPASPAPAEAAPNPTPPTQPQAAAPEEKNKPSNSGLTSQVPFVPAPTPAPEKGLTRSPLDDANAQSQRFQAAKAKALADKRVQELQGKADIATGDDARPAMRAYYKALYRKMREIDPTLHNRILRTEAATLRRVDTVPEQ